jgi:hypothetical protein
MACRQLIGLRDRVERNQQNVLEGKTTETGSRDQYQLYEILYASGGSAGVAGKEESGKWRQSAIRDGVIGGAKQKQCAD